MQRLTDHEKLTIQNIYEALAHQEKWDSDSLRSLIRKNRREDNSLYNKSGLIEIYRKAVDEKVIKPSELLEQRLKMKPIRTGSGVATVTVLTKPYPCPGQCIFCPNDVRMPKSYIASEPGAQRAEKNDFSPFLQTFNRLVALKNIGHDTTKIELIVLGGTWSYYPERYQIWFIKECFRALNEFNLESTLTDAIVDIDSKIEALNNDISDDKSLNSKTYNELITEIYKNRGEKLIPVEESATWDELLSQHQINENAHARCVGLVIETRPDFITEEEAIRMRKLGATKVQIGIQNLNDEVLKLNKRVHNSQRTREAITILRLAGFKIHAHWMPNLYGATPASDIEDYAKLWEPSVSPDELKIYPTSIIGGTELFELYKRGKYRPYSYDEILQVLTNTMAQTPKYCRLTRIIRDIPSQEIEAGNMISNFREIAEKELIKRGTPCNCIRCREIRQQKVTENDTLHLDIFEYKSGAGNEYLISFNIDNLEEDSNLYPRKLLGFLRLLIPETPDTPFIDELKHTAIIREVHVYGNVVSVGENKDSHTQHLGIGTKLLIEAENLARKAGYDKISVISAIGTRKYYEKKGFTMGELYMEKGL